MRSRLLLVLLLGVGLLLSAASPAADDLKIKFIGLHGAKVKLSVNRRIHLLEPGQVVKKRVKLMTADKSYAIVRVDGVNHLYKRGSTKGSPLPSEVVLGRDEYGMFASKGAINGKAVTFIIDTGASYVSLSSEHARKLKLRYKKNKPVKMYTASGTEKGYITTLDSVRVGPIVQHDVEAVILPGKFPGVILLGATFLRGMRITQTESLMKIAE